MLCCLIAVDSEYVNNETCSFDFCSALTVSRTTLGVVPLQKAPMPSLVNVKDMQWSIPACWDLPLCILVLMLSNGIDA
jgi:hypothetical protein